MLSQDCFHRSMSKCQLIFLSVATHAFEQSPGVTEKNCLRVNEQSSEFNWAWRGFVVYNIYISMDFGFSSFAQGLLQGNEVNFKQKKSLSMQQQAPVGNKLRLMRRSSAGKRVSRNLLEARSWWSTKYELLKPFKVGCSKQSSSKVELVNASHCRLENVFHRILNPGVVWFTRMFRNLNMQLGKTVFTDYRSFS